MSELLYLGPSHLQREIEENILPISLSSMVKYRVQIEEKYSILNYILHA